MEGVILFYDGECGLCNRIVQFIIRHEKKNCALYFATLQGSTARKILPSKGVSIVELSTLYVWNGREVLEKSNAALYLIRFLRWYWKFLYVCYVFPRPIRDWVYSQVAKRRKKIFSNVCFLPSKKLENRFL